MHEPVPFDPAAVEYPTSDVEPVGETDIHIRETVALRGILEARYRDVPDAYAGSNLVYYYEEGNPGAHFSPDTFVVLGVPNYPRRTFKIWEERKAPDFVLEVTSKGTRLVDRGTKKALYAELGVREYFMFDPEGDYLEPNLQGLVLVDGEYQPMHPEPDGSLLATTIGIRFAAERDRLRCIDHATSAVLVRDEELRAELADAERARHDAERARHDAEAEAERLRRRVAELESKLRDP